MNTPTAVEEKAVQEQHLTPEAGRRLLDRQARKYLDMSGSEFVAAWRRGEFKGKADRPEVMRVAMFLPLGG